MDTYNYKYGGAAVAKINDDKKKKYLHFFVLFVLHVFTFSFKKMNASSYYENGTNFLLQSSDQMVLRSLYTRSN